MTTTAENEPAVDAPGVPLIQRHRDYLAAGAVPEVFQEFPHLQPLLRSVVTWEQVPEAFRWTVEKETPSGILFGSGDGDWQFRPDSPKVDPDSPSASAPKYVSEKDSTPAPVRSAPLPAGVSLVDHTLVIQEGTKQPLAVAAALRADPNVVVVGINGCQNWRGRDGRLHQNIRAHAKGAKRILISLDGDTATNRLVYDAGNALKTALGNHLKGRRGVVSFVQIPTVHGATTGIDDLLADVPEEERAGYLHELFEDATPKPADVAPKTRDLQSEGGGSPFFKDVDPGTIEPLVTAEAVLDKCDVGVDILTGELACYNPATGVYEFDPPGQKSGRLRDAMLELLGGDYHGKHVPTTEDAVRKLVRERGQYLDHRVAWGEDLHVANGWLNMETRVLTPHTPERRSTRKFAIGFNPAASCPNVDTLLARAITLEDGFDQRPILFDGLSTLLDDGLPERMVFLIGKPRSGKGTTASLLAMLVGSYFSAVSLTSLATNRFSAARLYGSLLNLVGETEREHISEIAQVLMATGGDPIEGEKKGQDSFTFYNRALMVFLGNHLPTLSDPSGALVARTTAVLYPRETTGPVDPAIKKGVLQESEAEGLLLRLLDARQARKARGWKYLDNHPAVYREFQHKLNPVSKFADARLEATPPERITGTKTAPLGWVTRQMVVYRAYTSWCAATGAKPLRTTNFFEALAQRPISIGDGATSKGEVKGLLCRIKPDADGDYADPRGRPAATAVHIPGSHIGAPPAPDDAEALAAAAPAPVAEPPTVPDANPPTGGAATGAPQPLGPSWEPGYVPDRRDLVVAAARAATSTDPVMSRLTPPFWHLIEDRGAWLPKPGLDADETTHSRYLTAAATAPAHVLLSELAAAVNLPPLFARGYLRAIADRLDGLGIQLRDRRTAATGTPGATAALARWVSQEDRDAAKVNAQKAKSALSAANRAVKQAEKRRATSQADLAALRETASQAAAASAEASVQARNLSSLPIERHGFAVLISPTA